MAQDTQPARYEDIFGHTLPPQRNVYVFGQRIAFYDMGQVRPMEPVLVLLHGFGSQADVDFGAALPALSKTRRVIALDQIGAGNSAKPMMEYRVQTYVDFLGEFLRALGITRFDLLGESLGGWTAAVYTEQALAEGSTLPKPQRLILEDAAGFSISPAPSAPPKLMVSTVDEVITGLRAVLYNPALITPEIAKRRLISKLHSNDGVVTSTFTSNPAVRNEAAGEQASTITVPTLVLWGAQDKTVPVASGEAYTHAIPGAKLVLVEHSGHVPSLEQPAAFANTVEQFLSGR